MGRGHEAWVKKLVDCSSGNLAFFSALQKKGPSLVGSGGDSNGGGGVAGQGFLS